MFKKKTFQSIIKNYITCLKSIKNKYSIDNVSKVKANIKTRQNLKALIFNLIIFRKNANLKFLEFKFLSYFLQYCLINPFSKQTLIK